MAHGPGRWSWRALFEDAPRVLGSLEGDLDVGKLARDAAELDEVGLDRSIPHRQLEMVLPETEPGQLGVQGLALAAVGVLRESGGLWGPRRRPCGSGSRGVTPIPGMRLGRGLGDGGSYATRAPSRPRMQPGGLALNRRRCRPAPRQPSRPGRDAASAGAPR